MTWRVVEISSCSKLDLKMNYMVIRNVNGTQKVFIPEIAVLIIENTACSLTAALLCELSRQNVKVVFCNERRNPYGELMPYFGTHDSAEKLVIQASWPKDLADNVWARIVSMKISNQSRVLRINGHIEEANMLKTYADSVVPGDVTNREGHAAKVYFNALFGKDFCRRDDDPINSALNYGYSIILSAVNRDISALGYTTMIGVFHSNNANVFNLGSDLMEPFRPIVDEHVTSMNFAEFGSEQKTKILGILNIIVTVDGKKQYLLNAIRIFVQSFFNAMESRDESFLKGYEVLANEGEVHESDRILRPSCRDKSESQILFQVQKIPSDRWLHHDAEVCIFQSCSECTRLRCSDLPHPGP